jgi:hypothetical protein
VPIVLVRQSAASPVTHLQFAIDPVTTWCGQELEGTRIWRERWGQVTCLACVEANKRIFPRRLLERPHSR